MALHETRMGMKLIEGTIPRIAKALERIAKCLEEKAVTEKVTMINDQIRKTVYKAYEKGGLSTACETFNRITDAYKECKACATKTPHIKDECLICGQSD